MIFTIGHSTRTHEELFSLLDEHGVDFLLDVRSFPGSKYCPQWNMDEIGISVPHWLEYGWLPEIGGKRKPVKDSINTGWRNASFRAYADHMQTDEFLRGIDDLVEIADEHRVAIMCAEAVWWKCHRHMIADHLVGQDICEVFHIMDNGLNKHKLRDIAVVNGHTIIYPKE